VVFCGFRTATYVFAAGRVAQADALAALLEAAEPPLERRSGRLLGARAFWRAYRASFAHDDEHALHLRREAARFLRSAGDVRNAALEEANSGFLLLKLGAYEEASQILASLLAEGRRLGLAIATATNQHNLGFALLGLGRLEPALAVEREAVAAFAAGRNAQMEAGSRYYAARILVASGRARDAVAEAKRAVALLSLEHPIALTARASLADALLLCADPDDACAALDHARAAREALREDPDRFEEAAFILRVHLEALEANGLVDDAACAREEARAWVRERVGKIRSEHYRRTFEGSLDVARILTSPRGSRAE
jgi:tetratricopeptide (TPR) repeat protein